MYIIMSQHPVSEFIKAENHNAYIDNCNYFSMSNKKNKKDLFDVTSEWAEWYNCFDSTPLYIGIMTNNFYYKNCEDIINSAWITKWNIPGHLDDEAMKQMLPVQKRLWTHEEYFNEVWQAVENHNFNAEPFMEIKLDGSCLEE